MWMAQFEPVQQHAKHSVSAVDVTTCFSEVQEFWTQLAWPDSAGAFIFITRLTDVSSCLWKISVNSQLKWYVDIRSAETICGYCCSMQNLCSEAVCYAELLKRKIERNQLGQDHRTFTMQVLLLNIGEGNGLSFHKEWISLEILSPWQHCFFNGILVHAHVFFFFLSLIPLPFSQFFLTLLIVFLNFYSSYFHFFPTSSSSFSPYLLLGSSLWHLTTQNMCEHICPACHASWTGGLWSRLWRSHAVLKARSKWTRP